MQTMVESFKLSPQQKRLLLLQQNGYNSNYRVEGTILIEGQIDQDVLKSTFERVLSRYEIFRTSFAHLPGLAIPVQVIDDNYKSSLEFYDFSDLKSKKQESQLEMVFQKIRQKPYNLEQGPLVRIVQLILSPTRQLLYINMPALCGDGKTLQHLVYEISKAYDNGLQGNETSVEEEVLQYADISEWENELLESEEGTEGRIYWRNHHFIDYLDFVLDFEKPQDPQSEFVPKVVKKVLNPELAAKVTHLAEEQDVPLLCLFLASWQVLLWRLSGQSELVVGVECDGRTYEELLGSVGLLSKYLPIYYHFGDKVRFLDLLKANDRTLSNHMEWQEYFTWEIFSDSGNGRLATSFFPVCFNYEEFPKISLPEISFSLIEQTAYIDRFKLKLVCTKKEDQFTTEIHFDSNYIDNDEAVRLSRQLHVLLNSIVENPTTTVGDLDILSRDERKQILVDFNNTGTPYPADKCIHHLIEEKVEKVPDGQAILYNEQSLTYRELNQRANKLACYLQNLGVGPETLVGIYVEPSLEMMIGILGILKAGGAYVPLDPDYPEERLSLILEDTHAPVLLTQDHLKADIPECETQVICLDSDWEKIDFENEKPENTATPDNLAYIIYTSGSTGRPKGVPITHRNLVNSTHARLHYYQKPVGRFLLLSSFSFDSSIAGIFWSLCTGGTLVLPEAGLQKDPQPVVKIISENKITHILCLPSLYSLLLNENNLKKLNSLETVIVAGEECPIDLVKLHQQLLPEIELFNEYGPTEGTVWCTVYNCRELKDENHVPIGRPIPNTQIYLLNANMRPVPIGIPGELYIGGIGLTRGYLNQPDLAAEKLVPDPFSDRAGARLYKTGDLARFLPDGNIEFLGRTDFQVKIRGYRIELGEIEALLNQHSAIKQAIVVAKDLSAEATEDKRLVAYIIPEPGRKPNISELRNYLNKQLPEFMVPSHFVFMNSFPVTPNGKIDRKALPEPDRTRPELEATFVEPRNQVEEVLAGIWSELLNIEKVGINDNFFDLGGHSILVVQLVSRIREVFQEELPLRSVFEHPTILELAELLLEDPQKRARIEKTAELILKVSHLTDEEAEALLNNRT